MGECGLGMTKSQGLKASGQRPTGLIDSATSNRIPHPLFPVRWQMWSMLALAYSIVMFHRVAPGVVADRLMAEFEVGGAAVGVLTSIYFYIYAAMQIPSGALADAIGARKTVAAGASLAGVGSLIFGLAPTLGVAYLGRFLVGLGVSVTFIAAMKFQVNWFRPGEFGTVSGLLVLAGNLGAAGATSPVAMISQWLGWRGPFVVVGAVNCAVAIAVWRLVRDHPSNLGLPAQGGTENRPEGKRASHGASPGGRRFLDGAGVVWRSRQARAGFLAHFGLLGSYQTFTGLWAVPYLMQVYEMDRFEAASHLLVTTMVILILAPLGGYASDRLQRRKLPMLFLGSVSCASWLALTLWDGGRPPAWVLYSLFAALGFSSATVSLVLASVKEANPPHLAGLAMGTTNNGAFLCAGLLQPTMGCLLDTGWQGAMAAGARVYPIGAYQLMLAVLAGFAFLGLLGIALMKETHCRNVVQG